MNPAGAGKTASRHIPVVLNADDYGLTSAIGQAIRDLAERGRISATSCMTATPLWPSEGPCLKHLQGKIDIGLHITLTDQHCLGPMPSLAPEGRLPPLGRLSRLGWMRQLPLNEIRDEITRQLDAFVEVMGCLPDHLDGHHHVQQVPGIVDIVLDVAEEIGGAVYVRTAFDQGGNIICRRTGALKALAISSAGVYLRAEARRRKIHCNNGFSGFYDFRRSRRYPQFFETFLQRQNPGAIIMCHPGLVDDHLRRIDTLIEPREYEYRYLRGRDFNESLDRHMIRLDRMKHIAPVSR